MRKKIKFIVICVLVVTIVCSWINLIFKSESHGGKLYVCGNLVSENNIEIFSLGSASYANLPFVVVLQKLGFDIKWKNNNLAYINNIYVLDLNRCFFYKQGDYDNWLEPLIGGSYTRIIVYKDIILDCWTIKSIIRDMGVEINIEFDFDKSIVYIIKSGS